MKSVIFLFANTAAGVVSCGGHYKPPRTSTTAQIIFSFWSFEISEGIVRNQNFMINLDIFLNMYCLTLFGFTRQCVDCQFEILQNCSNFLWLHVAKFIWSLMRLE